MSGQWMGVNTLFGTWSRLDGRFSLTFPHNKSISGIYQGGKASEGCIRLFSVTQYLILLNLTLDRYIRPWDNMLSRSRNGGDDMKGRRPFSDTECREIMSAFTGRCSVRDRCMFMLGVTAGLRVSEALSLTIADVTNGHGEIRRTVTIPAEHTKRNTDFTQHLSAEAMASISDWLAVLRDKWGYTEPSAYLFQSRQGPNKAISRQRAWQIIKDIAAVIEVEDIERVGTHSLRKSFARRFYSSGYDLVNTSRALGHTTTRTTELYLQGDDEAIAKTIQDMKPIED